MSFLPKTGDIFSGCEILGRCGKGAFGVTFLARNPLGEKIIIKIVSAVNRSERELEGLRNYMTVAGKHPNLLQIFHIGEMEDGFYYTMEAADDCSADAGKYSPATLGNLIRSGKRFTPAEAISITRSLLGGITVMHQGNLVHRDIKPDNIIFVNGQPKLSDPGLVVELGQSASFAGTFGFLPPEAMQEEMPPDQSFDLYALGKVFYCMISGNSPKKYPELPLDMPLEVCRQLYAVLHKVCNHNPEKRFKSAGEFLALLPEKLDKPTRIEKFRQRFRIWQHNNYGKYRVLSALSIFLILLLLAGGVYLRHRKNLQGKNLRAAIAADAAEKRHLHRLQKISVQKFLDFHTARGSLLELQLKLDSSDTLAEYQKLLSSIKHSFKQQDFPQADRQVGETRAILCQCAEKLLPPLPETENDFASAMTVSGKVHSFLATPLSEFLSAEVKNKCRKKLEKFDQTLYKHWQGPRCGKEWDTMQDFELPMVFVPSGAVKMQHNRKTVELPYFFWMGKYEVTGESFAHQMGFSPRRNPRSNTPVERVAWNDILFYCYKITTLMQSAGKLPPGYIVRPPNEAEWEFAANNAWLGKDDLLLLKRARCNKNSARHSWQVGSLEPNKLGLYDIYGNVAELVQPIEKTQQQNSAVIRGGSFLNSPQNCLSRQEYLKYQTIPYTVGFRIAIAPGTMEYFDKEFFNGGAVQTRIGDQIYELIGTNYGAFSWHSANALSSLLGGSLVELQGDKHLAELQKNMPLFAKWLAVIGGRKTKGQWQWIRSKNSIDFGSWNRQVDNSGEFLMLNNKHFFKAHSNTKAPLMLCQWSVQEYAQRHQVLKKTPTSPIILKRFSWQGRHFMLINLTLQWYAAQRVCELMNGRLAVLDDEELMQYAIKQLKPHAKHRILLGAYAKRDKYFWLNGKELNGKFDDERVMPIPTKNLNFIVLKDGKLYDSQFSCMFLCEWDAKTASSFWR